MTKRLADNHQFLKHHPQTVPALKANRDFIDSHSGIAMRTSLHEKWLRTHPRTVAKLYTKPRTAKKPQAGGAGSQASAQ